MKRRISAIGLILFWGLTCICNAHHLMEQLVAEESDESIPIWGHTEPSQNMDAQYESLSKLLSNNPYVQGVTIKVRWNTLHPTEEYFNIEGLSRLVDLCTKKGVDIGFELQPGWWTPEWVMAKGVDNIGPMSIGSVRSGTIDKCPMVWDATYKKYLKADLRRIAHLLNNNPRVRTITLMGHNYKGSEMHVAKVNEIMIKKGFSEELVLNEWEEWMDFYATTFASDKRLLLCVSQTYTRDLPAKIVDLFVSKYKERAELNNCQLDGRQDMAANGSMICKLMEKYPDVPISFEMVGSFMEQPERQGSAEMTIYNARNIGKVCYLRLWRRDLTDTCYAENLVKAWDKYKHLSLSDFKKRLIEEGLYKEKSTWKRPLVINHD